MKMIKSCGTKATMLALICASALSSQTLTERLDQKSKHDRSFIETQKTVRQIGKYYIDMKIIPPANEEDQTIREVSYEICPGESFIFGRPEIQDCVPKKQHHFISRKHLQIEFKNDDNDFGVYATHLSKMNPSYFNVDYSLEPTETGTKKVGPKEKTAGPYNMARINGDGIEHRPVGIKYHKSGWILLSFRGHYRYTNGQCVRMETDKPAELLFFERFTALESLEEMRVQKAYDKIDALEDKKRREADKKEAAQKWKGDEEKSTPVYIIEETEDLESEKYYIDLIAPHFEWSFELQPGKENIVRFGFQSSDDLGNALLKMEDTMSNQHLEFSFVDDNDPKKGITVKNLTVNKRPTYIFRGHGHGMAKMNRYDEYSLTEFTRKGNAVVVPYEQGVMQDSDDDSSEEFKLCGIRFGCRGKFYLNGKDGETCDLTLSRNL